MEDVRWVNQKASGKWERMISIIHDWDETMARGFGALEYGDLPVFVRY